MNDGRRAGRKGFELRGWHVIVGMLVVLVVLFILFRVFGHSAMERKIAELRAKGYPTTFEELEKYNQLPEGVPNAADLYVKAFDAYQSPFEDEKMLLPYIGSIKPDDPITPEVKAAMEKFLSRNIKTLELLHQAEQIEQCRYDYPITGYSSFMNPYSTELKHCSQLLTISIMDQTFEDKGDLAFQKIIDQIHLGESLSREPLLLSFLVRLAVDASASSSVQLILRRLILNDQQLAELQAEFWKTRNDLQVCRCVIGERCFMLDEMTLRLSLGYGIIPARWSGLIETNLIRSLEYTEKIEVMSRLKPEERYIEYCRFEEEIQNLPFWFSLTKAILPIHKQMCMIELRVIGELDCTRAALGVERFRLAEGRLPETLEQLVPKYLEAVPIDPFDGKPLRYKRLEKGYTIYSIGEDGEDDGGLPRSKVGKGANYDWPFTVER